MPGLIPWCWGPIPARCQRRSQAHTLQGCGGSRLPSRHPWTLSQPRGKTGSTLLPGNAELLAAAPQPLSPGQPVPEPPARRVGLGTPRGWAEGKWDPWHRTAGASGVWHRHHAGPAPVAAGPGGSWQEEQDCRGEAGRTRTGTQHRAEHPGRASPAGAIGDGGSGPWGRQGAGLGAAPGWWGRHSQGCHGSEGTRPTGLLGAGRSRGVSTRTPAEVTAHGLLCTLPSRHHRVGALGGDLGGLSPRGTGVVSSVRCCRKVLVHGCTGAWVHGCVGA